MIIIKIMGGLGNQIAQYLFGRVCADRLGVELKLDLREYRTYKLHAYGLENFAIRADVATDAEILKAQETELVRERSMVFDQALVARVRDGIYLDGYWADYRYTQPGIKQLQVDFIPKQKIHPDNLTLLTHIQQENSVSLHIRRGDYVTNPNCVVLPLAYYEDAIKEITARVAAPHIYIFSDDMTWVEEHLHPKISHTYVRGNDASRNLDDFELMRSCKHHIIANSTFSGWAAILDEKAGYVIAPQQYFAPQDPYLLSTFDSVDQPIWPKNWISIPIRKNISTQTLKAHIPGGFQNGKPMVIGVWNFYEELTTDGFIFKNNNASIGHDLLKPWCDLHKYGKNNGLRFVTIDQASSLEDLDVIIFQDRPRPGPVVDRLLALSIPKYLCIFETEVIKPDNWDLVFHKRMDRIFTWSDVLVDYDRYIKINFSIDPESPFDFDVLKSAFQQRKLCTLIAGAKHSEHTNELYSARRHTIEWMQHNAPQDFDLYGVGWNPQEYPSYRGSVRDKLSVLARYRFAICYENAEHYAGYITEKILDCFRAGVIPVYKGAPNISQWIPNDCFIDRNAFESEEALFQHLARMDVKTHNEYMDRIQRLLTSPQIYPFTIECFITTVSGLIAKDVKTLRGECADVTIVIPSYNYAKFIETTITSALSQQYPEKTEVLVYDNASTDNTREISAKFATDSRFRYMCNSQNIGGPRNWTNALQTASGRYIVVLSADDFLLPNHLQKMIGVMDSHPNISIAYCPCIWVDEVGNHLYVANSNGHRQHDYIGGRNEVTDLLTHDCYITPSAALIRRTAFEKVGTLDLSLKGAIDWDLWIRIAEKSPDFAFFKEATVCYRTHASQDTLRLLGNAGLLEDHIKILQRLVGCGNLNSESNGVTEIIGLLRRKFQTFDASQVEYLLPQLVELEKKLLKPPATDHVHERLHQAESSFIAALRGTLDIFELLNTAEQLSEINRLDLASNLYRLWLAQTNSPLRYAAAFNLGTILEAMGTHEEAMGAYRLSNTLRPDFEPAKIRLNYLLAKLVK